jgi:serine/threonine protein kinase
MLSKAGKVKILDFGLARIGGQGKDRVQGTPEYLAPEQASHGMVNERTDVFNFGATMYRLCAWTNVPSVVEDGVLVPPVMWQRLLKPVGSINTQVPKQLAGLIHRCLQHNAHLRPEHAGEVHELLREIREKLVKEPQDRLVEE